MTYSESEEIVKKILTGKPVTDQELDDAWINTLHSDRHKPVFVDHLFVSLYHFP